MDSEAARLDFFISYTGVDMTWARWIAVELERAGYHTFSQVLDIRPGHDFVHEMQKAAGRARCTIAVWSPAYEGSQHGEAEWRAAFAADPSGGDRKLIPVRVAAGTPAGLLRSRVYIDVVDCDEDTARARLLEGVGPGGPRPSKAAFPDRRPEHTGSGDVAVGLSFPSREPTVSNMLEREVPVSSVPSLRGDEVARPDLSEALIAAVSAPGTGAVGVTTGLIGAGGFGKTTLARIVAHDSRVRDEFTGGRVWVTVGQDATGPDLAGLITATARLFDRLVPDLTDLMAAGAALGRVLNGRRVLLVVDDLWTTAQVEPFLLGGDQAVRLFTTRQQSLLPASVIPVRVDQMTTPEARELLTSNLPAVPPRLVDEALRLCGSWPVLLSLVHGTVRDAVYAGGNPATELSDVLAALGTNGVTVLDIADSDERHRAVGRTIEVGLGRLIPTERDRYLELAVFREDVAIPGDVLSRLWEHTAGWSAFRSRRFCQRLADLALLADYRRNPDQVQLHDVIRSYLREQTEARHTDLNQALIDAHRDLVTSQAGRSMWAELDATQIYLWAWLPSHLAAAGLDDELAALLDDPRWLIGKLDHVGPAGLEADLLLSSNASHQGLARVVRQNAHVLGRLDPSGPLTATLVSRIPLDNPSTGQIRERLLGTISGIYIEAVATPPDLPHPALARVLTGHSSWSVAAAAAPDGSWLAAASDDGTIRIWSPTSGVARHTLNGHTDRVTALAVAADGTWLASASRDGTVRVWDPTTGATRHSLTSHTPDGHTAAVVALAAAPDGTWLASGGDDGTVRVWDPATGAIRHTLNGHTDRVTALAVAADGTWLASASRDGTVRVWDPTTGATRHSLTSHTPDGHTAVLALAAAPDGSWLAAASDDGTIRVWDPTSGAIRHSLTGHTDRVSALTIALDGTWLASGGDDGTVRVWDPASGAIRHTLTGHTDPVEALAAAPDGTWLASASWDGQVLISDSATGQTRDTLRGNIKAVVALAVSPDGTWLASAGHDDTVRIWDPAFRAVRDYPSTHANQVEAMTIAPNEAWLASASADRTVRTWDPTTGAAGRTLIGHANRVTSVTMAPDGDWVASASWDHTVRIWDPNTGTTRHLLTGHDDLVVALAAARDGSWLASASWDHTVRTWDPTTGATRHVLTGHTDRVVAVVVGPDDRWLASASWDGTIRIWDTTTGDTRGLLTDTSPVDTLAISPQGNWIASAGDDGTVRIWDPTSGLVRHVLKGHTNSVESLTFSPDGKSLASAGRDGTVRIWDANTGRIRHVLPGHPSRVAALTFLPNASGLASVGDDGTLRVWDPITGQPVASMRVGHALGSVVGGNSGHIVVAGDRGPYFLAMARRPDHIRAAEV